MSKDEEWDLFWDRNASARRLQEAPDWEEQVAADPIGDEQFEADEVPQSPTVAASAPETPPAASMPETPPVAAPAPEAPPVAAISIPDHVDRCLQRAVEAGTSAYESDSPEAWREVVAAVTALADMAQTREVVAEIRQSARQMAQAAEVAQRLAQEAVDVAAKAMQKAEQIEAVAARASEANSGEAWREAHQTVLALTASERTATLCVDRSPLAPSRSLLRRLEVNTEVPASKAQ